MIFSREKCVYFICGFGWWSRILPIFAYFVYHLWWTQCLCVWMQTHLFSHDIESKIITFLFMGIRPSGELYWIFYETSKFSDWNGDISLFLRKIEVISQNGPKYTEKRFSRRSFVCMYMSWRLFRITKKTIHETFFLYFQEKKWVEKVVKGPLHHLYAVGLFHLWAKKKHIFPSCTSKRQHATSIWFLF